MVSRVWGGAGHGVSCHTLQICIVQLIRNRLAFASWKNRKLLAAALKTIYCAPSAEAAEQAMSDFECGPWGQRFPTVVAVWRRAWDRVIPFFFGFPPAVRRLIYTTKAIESCTVICARSSRQSG